jgi:hypothetical protein
MHKIICKKDGTIECVYNDALELQNLGQLTIKRASDVIFNEDHQSWVIQLKKHVKNHEEEYIDIETCIFKSRNEAIKQEINYLTAFLTQETI